MRDSGLSVAEKVPWGTSFCHFFKSADDIVDVMVPYFASGLRNNERCIWVCAEPLEVEAGERALSSVVPDLDAFLASGKMQIISYRQWYLDFRNGFSVDEVLRRWYKALDKALDEGFDGLRLAGNASWVDETIWESFMEYEKRLHCLLANEPALVICSYPRKGAAIPDVIGVMRNHQRALVRSANGWELVRIQEMTEFQHAERADDMVARIIAHELRNPLQVIEVLVQLLREMTPGGIAAVKRYAEALGSQVDHLSSLVEDILTAWSVDADRLEIHPEPADLVMIVEDSLKPMMEAAEHEIIVPYPKDLTIPVRVDKVRIRQIITNLIGNAVKYTPPGKRIWVDISQSDEYALVRIADEGIGIPKGETDLVFRPFYRATNSVCVSKEGLGLGLYICRQLARRHGGDLWAEERPGGGTVMNLRLPVRSRSGGPQ